MTDNTQGQAVAARNEKPSLAAALESMKPELERVLPAHLSGDRMARITLTEIRKNPKLANTNPASFFGALLTAAALGLEPGVGGEAYLVPYKQECQLIIGYQGLVKMFWQHPLAKRLSADVVFEKDHFAFDKGLAMRLEHTPAHGDRGRIIGYYAIAELSTGGMNFDFFTPDEIKALRGGKVGTSGDIKDSANWMERKTALKQVLKLMPKSVELTQAVQVDETVGSLAVAEGINQGSGLPQIEHAEPVAEEGADQ